MSYGIDRSKVATKTTLHLLVRRKRSPGSSTMQLISNSIPYGLQDLCERLYSKVIVGMSHHEAVKNIVECVKSFCITVACFVLAAEWPQEFNLWRPIYSGYYNTLAFNAWYRYIVLWSLFIRTENSDMNYYWLFHYWRTASCTMVIC
jgi:hypothetical protein